MTAWRRSSHSGEGDGDNCVEIAASPTRVAVRDSKASNRAVLTFSGRVFTEFVKALKESAGPPA
ncbi:DUF397 domain-containing protein [Streptomyces sp. Vc74B-19]|uniref:DUF397 domain-containing protein n=1 Tax=unclassified Streptomyces TaxID=2593676 RepID=UPI001BFC400F|nr:MULTISPECIES: DUF397 domain-containing protein [unclassified Streptomyces]MBT3161783.1 DUF397 domain-containing protein [Streptomyces sp. Vc74B-19]MCO4694110.1 hypothetical protein [Streptomyces sp. RO-S4]